MGLAPADGVRAVAAAVALASLAACTTSALAARDDGRVNVVTTTGILADIARNVAGDRAHVVSLVPEGGDPHSYEPSLRDVRNVVYADVAFTNYLLLEEHSVIKALDANLPEDAPSISLAEESTKYGAHAIALVEDVTLDTVWLGLRVRGTGARHDATRSSDVLLAATGLDGPGDLVTYLTGSFGDVDVYADSRDGFDAATGYRDDTATLPPDAHTHMSWAFTAPGVYRLDVAAQLKSAHDARPVPVGAARFTFAVGIDPREAARQVGIAEPIVVDGGHADLTVDVDQDSVYLLVDPTGGEETPHEYPADQVVVEVPNKARTEVPGDPAFRFLGRAGEPIYQLPQAVLGKHVHGEIDPHLWQDVRNVEAYAKVIRDALIEVDPGGTSAYVRNAAAYLETLGQLDDEVRATIAQIPPDRRHLVTTHDAFAYLAAAYGLTISGFVTPNPATEPSLADRRRLADTIRNLSVPAVFLEPNLVARSSTLRIVAEENGAQVCPIYGDAFDREVTTYVDLMRANARSLLRCLGDPNRSPAPATSTAPTAPTGHTH